MMYSSSSKHFALNTEEKFMNVEDIAETPETIKAYFPKLMPKIEMGEAANTSIKLQIDRGIFVNASDCAVCNTPSVVNGQNYITLSPHSNERPNYRAKAELRNNVYIVPKHSTFIAEILNDDIQSIFFTGKT